MKYSELPGFVAEKTVAELRRWKRKLFRRAERLVEKTRRFIEPTLYKHTLKHRQIDFSASKRAERFRKGDDTFVLYRIVGNALAPRHAPEQVLHNLQFQLDHEIELESCRKIWVVNRIFDPELRESVIQLLTDHRAEFFEIPFDIDEYRQIDTTVDERFIREFLEQIPEESYEKKERAELAKIRLKRLYAMNNNGARNTALEHGRDKAKWILPWDGNCFISPKAWERIANDVRAASHLPYHIVYMARTRENTEAINHAVEPDAQEEPQIIFHRDSCDVFDETIPYGRRPKVELLDRIGVWGPWRDWWDDPWDINSRHESPFKYLFAASSGWVYRLSSGRAHMETGENAGKHRLQSRNQAILNTIRQLDERASGQTARQTGKAHTG